MLNWLNNGNEHNVNNRVLVCTNSIISSSDIVGVKHDFCPLSYFRFESKTGVLTETIIKYYNYTNGLNITNDSYGKW